MSGNEIVIRKFSSKNRPEVRRIGCETSIVKEVLDYVPWRVIALQGK